MIRWLEDPSLLNPRSVKGRPCMNVAIRCGLRVAGPGACRDFWLQTGPGGEPRGWAMENGGRVWAALTDPEDREAAEEMAQFLLAKGFRCLEADEAVARAVGLPHTTLPVMACARLLPGRELPEGFALAEGPVAGLTEVLLAAGALPEEGRDSFYACRHLHVRRGCEAVFLGRLQGRTVSCGVLSWAEGAEAAVTCVAVIPEYRGKGFALATVREIARRCLEAGHVPFLACREELVPLYEKAGFQRNGLCALTEIPTK